MTPRRLFASVLIAHRADPVLADRLKLFGQFVGSWDVDIRDHPDDASERRVQGEWHFAWVLEGRAIQDVWIAPKRTLRGCADDFLPGEYGTTLRFYDPEIDAWRSTWHAPVRGIVRTFIARPARG